MFPTFNPRRPVAARCGGKVCQPDQICVMERDPRTGRTLHTCVYPTKPVHGVNGLGLVFPEQRRGIISEQLNGCSNCYPGMGAAAYREVGAELMQPPGVQVLNEAAYLAAIGEEPWYKKPLVWLAIGGGAAAAGLAGYLVYRRR